MERKKAPHRKAAEREDARKKDALRRRSGKPGLVLYLDTSAIVKKYVSEHGSAEITSAIGAAQVVGSVLLARVEFAAAAAKAVRTGALTDKEARACLEAFHKEWASYYVGQVTAAVVSRAEALVSIHQLRGYDAVHLAAASIWQDDLGEPVTMATFDRDLWNAAAATGLVPSPEDLPELLQQWGRAGPRRE